MKPSTKQAFWGILLLFSGAASLFAQQETWQVNDRVTGEPIPFATVLTGPDKGTISNEEGLFSLDLDNVGPAGVRISCMGYKTQNLGRDQFAAADRKILLEPAAIQLNEVQLGTRIPGADEIVRLVRENLPANYPKQGMPYQLFYRESEHMQFQKLDLELEKASDLNKAALQQADARLRQLGEDIVRSNARKFLDFSGAYMAQNDTASVLQVDRVTELVDHNKDFSMDNIQERAKRIVLSHLDSTQTYKLKTGMFKIEDSISPTKEFVNSEPEDSTNLSYLKGKARGLADIASWKEGTRLREFLDPDLYEYAFLKATYFDGNYVYAVGFEPDRRKAKYSGTLYVDANTYAVLKADYQYASGKTGEKVNLKLLLGIRFEENLSRGTVIFRRNETNQFFPYFVQQQYGNYIYLHRDLKFIENSSQGKKVKFDFFMEGGVRQSESALLRPLHGPDAAALGKAPQPKKVYLVKLDHYEPTIWQDTEVIEPLEAMRNFRVKKD